MTEEEIVTRAQQRNLSENHCYVYIHRKRRETFREIGLTLGRSIARICQMYAKAALRLEAEDHWTLGLNIRAIRFFEQAGIVTKEQAVAAAQGGLLNPRCHPKLKNYGVVTQQEIFKHLRLDWNPDINKLTAPTADSPLYGELSVRTSNVLRDMGLFSKEAIRSEFKSGRVFVGPGSPRNFGLKSYGELAAWIAKTDP